MQQNNFFGSWEKILVSIKTPLSLLGLIVLALSAVLTYTLPKVSGSSQTILIFGSIFLLFSIIVTVTTHSIYKKVENPIPSLWGPDHLPIDEKEKQCWLGPWAARWMYKTTQGTLEPYVDDIIKIDEIELSTGILSGTATSSYSQGDHYKITGRVTNKSIAQIFYTSPPPRLGLSGMAIMRRIPSGSIKGWWLGVDRGKGGDIGGRVVWNRLEKEPDFTVQSYVSEHD